MELSIKQASEILGVHADTLRNWEAREMIAPVRVRAGRRYTIEMLRKLHDDIHAGVYMAVDKLPGFALKEWVCTSCKGSFSSEDLRAVDPGYSKEIGCPLCHTRKYLVCTTS